MSEEQEPYGEAQDQAAAEEDNRTPREMLQQAVEEIGEARSRMVEIAMGLAGEVDAAELFNVAHELRQMADVFTTAACLDMMILSDDLSEALEDATGRIAELEAKIAGSATA